LVPVSTRDADKLTGKWVDTNRFAENRDVKAGKPWLDKNPTAGADFYKNVGEWYPTWGRGHQRGMTVKSVNMWQEDACGLYAYLFSLFLGLDCLGFGSWGLWGDPSLQRLKITEHNGGINTFTLL
jgi:hypothetical protein